MPTAGFVDVAFLKKEGAKALGKPDHETRIDAARVVGWIRDQAWGRFLRAYWYDGRSPLSILKPRLSAVTLRQ